MQKLHQGKSPSLLQCASPIELRELWIGFGFWKSLLAQWIPQLASHRAFSSARWE
jgi:hypothetical protein